MKKNFFILSFLSIFSFSLSSTPIPKELNIYSDSSYLISEYITTVKGWKDIYITIPKNSLVFLEPVRCNLEYVEDQKLSTLNEVKNLKEDIKTLEAQILSLKSILNLSNNIGFESGKYVKSVKALETFFEKKYLEYIDLKEKLDKKRKNLIYIKKTIQPVNVSIFCPSIETVKIKTRSPIDVKSEVFYYVFGNTKKNTVYLENRIKLKVDRDLRSIKVNIFQYRTQPQIYKNFINRFAASKLEEKTQRKYTETTTRYFYTISSVSLKKDLYKNILISKAISPAQFKVVINGRLGSVPNLIAYLKPKRMFPSAKAYFYIDGIFLKSGYLNTLQRGEQNKISFGEDKLIKVYKEKVKDTTLQASKDKIVRYVKWRYIIKNKHTKRIPVKLIEYIPTSNSYNIKIEPVSSLLWKDYNKVNGRLVWEFNIPPNRDFILEFGYKETKPLKVKK